MRIAPPVILAAVLALAACATDDPDGTDPAPDEQPDLEAPDDEAAPGDPGDPADPGEPGDDPGVPDDLGLDLPDPGEMVSDGVFRSEGLVLPAPDGWVFDQMALAQGIVSAAAEDGDEYFAGQVIDTSLVDEEMTVDSLIETNRGQIPDEPALDEAVEIEGAVEARQLRYDGIAAQMEGQPDTSVLLVVADDGEGRIAIFNYAAATDAFDEEHAELLLSTAAFDPDSEPTPPPPPPMPEGTPDMGEAPELDEPAPNGNGA